LSIFCRYLEEIKETETRSFKMCLHILACLLPPLAVCFKRGVGCDCCINCGLTILGGIPGCCHACYVVSQDEPTYNTTVIMQPTQGPPPGSIIVGQPQPKYWVPWERERKNTAKLQVDNISIWLFSLLLYYFKSVTDKDRRKNKFSIISPYIKSSIRFLCCWEIFVNFFARWITYIIYYFFSKLLVLYLNYNYVLLHFFIVFVCIMLDQNVCS